MVAKVGELVAYTVTCVTTGKVYVGATGYVRSRWQSHRRQTGDSPLLYASIREYGLDDHVFEVVACARTRDDLRELERQLVAQFDSLAPNGLNMTRGGLGLSGFQFSDESRAKMREAGKRQKRGPLTDEERAKRGLGPRPEPRPPILPRGVITPDGEFSGVAEAAEFYGLCRRWANRCATEGFRGWRYADAAESPKKVRPARQKSAASD